MVYSRHQARSVFDHWYNKEHITFHGAFSCFFHVCMIVPQVPDKKEMEMQGIAIELHIDCNCINICQNKALLIPFIYYTNQNWMLFWMLSRRPGLHNLFHPTIRDGSTWSKLGVSSEHVENMEMFYCSPTLSNFVFVFVFVRR